jgi:hypothetical protein
MPAVHSSVMADVISILDPILIPSGYLPLE